MSEWLGHRDLCPTQWGKPCDCVADVSNCLCVDGSLTFECPVHGWDNSTADLTCSSPANNHGDGRGCDDENCPRHGNTDR